MWLIYEHKRLDKQLVKAPLEIHKRYEKWKDVVTISGPAGMAFHSPPTEVGIPGVRTVYGRDPFGNVVELEEAQGRFMPQQPPVPAG